MNYKLISDHYSKGKDKTLYGLRNDKVTMIHETDNVCIVENKLGQRFPIDRNLIQTI